MAATLLSTAALVIDPGRMTYVQGTVAGADVELIMADCIIEILKEKNPTLAALAAEEDRGL